jgi:alkanesulfonate monooxygenase SsuD/methylene tetrahydromethanopterin reductase-like flavin-dependent oxidoreductase (luciferase family)
LPKLGYLLPTRERVMEGRHETGSLLALAERVEGLGYDSIWVGDSLMAKPRHDPLILLAAIAGRAKKAELGTAVLLSALRNPVLLAHQAATLDRLCEGRLILGIGIAADTPANRSTSGSAA